MVANHSTRRVDARPRLDQMTKPTGRRSRSNCVNTSGFSTSAQGPQMLYGVFSRRRNEKTPCSRVAEMAGTGSPTFRSALPDQARTERISAVLLGKDLESRKRATPAVRVQRPGSVETSGKCDRLKLRKVASSRTTSRLPPPARSSTTTPESSKGRRARRSDALHEEFGIRPFRSRYLICKEIFSAWIMAGRDGAGSGESVCGATRAGHDEAGGSRGRPLHRRIP